MTASEARLAALLARTRHLKFAAGAMNITLNTAKTHLRGVFRKTGTRRQSELLQRLEVGAAQMGDPGRAVAAPLEHDTAGERAAEICQRL